MTASITSFHHVILLMIVLCLSEHTATYASLIPENSTADHLSDEKYSIVGKETWNFLERNLQIEESTEPVPSQESMEFPSFLESAIQESPEPSQEDALEFSSFTTEPMTSAEDIDDDFLCQVADVPTECEAEFRHKTEFFENEVSTEPDADSDFVVVQSEDEPRREQAASSIISSSFRFPICVIRRKQMNCFVRKRCGFFRKNVRRVTGSRGPAFNWIRKRGCISKCGFKAGRNCVSG